MLDRYIYFFVDRKIGELLMDMWKPDEEKITLTKKEINSIRHRKEWGIYLFAVLVNVTAVLIVCSWLIGEMTAFYQQLQDMALEQNITVGELDMEAIRKVFETAWYEPENQVKIQIFFYVGALVLFTIFILEYFYAHVRAKAIRVTPDQFSEIYGLAVQYAHVLGLKKIPEIYLAQENGVLNAFASNIIRRRFIQINIDLLEIAYRQHRDLASIGFILAHEMAHIKLRHVYPYGFGIRLF